MFKFLKHRAELRRIAHIIDFDCSFNIYPTLWFQYNFDGEVLNIKSDNNIFNTPFVLKYKLNSTLTINNKEISNNFANKFIFKAITNSYKKLIERKDFEKRIIKSRKEAKKFIDPFFKNTSNEFNYSNSTQSRTSKRTLDFNTDILFSDDSRSSSSSSRNSDGD